VHHLGLTGFCFIITDSLGRDNKFNVAGFRVVLVGPAAQPPGDRSAQLTACDPDMTLLLPASFFVAPCQSRGWAHFFVYDDATGALLPGQTDVWQARFTAEQQGRLQAHLDSLCTAGNEAPA
jgi:hypothetical protein